MAFGAVGTSAVAEEALRLAVPGLLPNDDRVQRKEAAIARRLLVEAEAMALEAVEVELAGASPRLPTLLRPSGLVFFRVLSMSHAQSEDVTVATYIGQHPDETFECGEIAWTSTNNSPQLQRHDRRFFDPMMLQDASARRKLQHLGCL
ncbi:MAG: hypothetical protein AAGA38_03455 [Pseudomonadota bacterium]